MTGPTLSETASVHDNNWRAGRKKLIRERRLKITEVGEGGQPRLPLPFAALIHQQHNRRSPGSMLAIEISADTAFYSMAWNVPILGKCDHNMVGFFSFLVLKALQCSPKSGRDSGEGYVCQTYLLCLCKGRGWLRRALQSSEQVPEAQLNNLP